jgi:hypothetical protein
MNKDALRAPRPLTDQHEPGRLEPAAVARLHNLGASDDPADCQIGPQEVDRVPAQGQSDMAVILDHLAASRHRPEGDDRLIDFGHGLVVARRGRREQRQRLISQRLDRPERFAPGEPHRRPEGVGLGELDQRDGGHASAAPKVIDRQKGPVSTGGDDGRGMDVGQPFHHAHAEPHGEPTVIRRRARGTRPT